MKKLMLIVSFLNLGPINAVPFFLKEVRFSTPFGKEVREKVDQQRLEWEKLESAKGELTSFAKYSCATSALLFIIGALAYIQPDSETATVSFGEVLLGGSVLSASGGILHECMYGKNTICEHSELFLEILSKLDSYSAESNKKMDGSKISMQERERVEKYMNALRAEWKQKLDACKKTISSRNNDAL